MQWIFIWKVVSMAVPVIFPPHPRVVRTRILIKSYVQPYLHDTKYHVIRQDYDRDLSVEVRVISLKPSIFTPSRQRTSSPRRLSETIQPDGRTTPSTLLFLSAHG